MVAFSRMLVLAEHAIVLCFVWRFLFYLRSKGIYGILRTVLAGVVEGAKVNRDSESCFRDSSSIIYI